MTKEDQEAAYWKRLSKDEAKRNWLTVDWDRWKDEDSEDEADDDFAGGMPGMGGNMPGMGGNMPFDMSQFANMGMNMGDMPGDDDDDDDSDDDDDDDGGAGEPEEDKAEADTSKDTKE